MCVTFGHRRVPFPRPAGASPPARRFSPAIPARGFRSGSSAPAADARNPPADASVRARRAGIPPALPAI